MSNPIIYIIDDDADDQEFLIEVLKDIDPSSQIFTAMNGQEGRKKLDAHIIPFPSIIFLDLNMPKISGKQFLSELKDDPNFRFIPVVIYTTSSQQRDIDELKHLGASDYLVKELDYSILKEKLNSILSLILQK